MENLGPAGRTRGPDGMRSIESVIAELDRAGPAEVPRPWPLRGRSIGAYEEERYREALRARPVATSLFCLRRNLMVRNDADFVVAAFRVIAGHEPERSLWHYHVDRLASGDGTRDELLRDLQASPAGQDRRIVMFDDGLLRPFAEMTGIGLQDVVRLLLGLGKRQLRLRWRMGVAWLLRLGRLRQR